MAMRVKTAMKLALQQRRRLSLPTQLMDHPPQYTTLNNKLAIMHRPQMEHCMLSQAVMVMGTIMSPNIHRDQAIAKTPSHPHLHQPHQPQSH